MKLNIPKELQNLRIVWNSEAQFHTICTLLKDYIPEVQTIVYHSNSVFHIDRNNLVTNRRETIFTARFKQVGVIELQKIINSIVKPSPSIFIPKEFLNKYLPIDDKIDFEFKKSLLIPFFPLISTHPYFNDDSHDFVFISEGKCEIRPLKKSEREYKEMTLSELKEISNVYHTIQSPSFNVGKPSLGIVPKYIWIEQVYQKRLKGLNDAINRRLEASQEILIEWINERNEILELLRNNVNEKVSKHTS